MATPEELLKEMFKIDPVKAIQCVLILISEQLADANAKYMDVTQELTNEKGDRLKIKATFTMSKVKPKSAP